LSTPQARILVVEDEPDLLRIVEIYLRRWGFIVDGFIDPLEALAHFKKNHQIHHVVITDIKMPGMTGIEFAIELRKLRPDIKIILMTAFEVMPGDLETMLTIIKYDELLLKPFKLMEICNAVKRLLQVSG